MLKCWNHLSFASISPTLVNDTWRKGLYEFSIMKSQKFNFIKKKNMFNWVFLLSCFCKQFLAYTVHIDWCCHSIDKHLCRSQHISVLTTMYRFSFEGRHLVFLLNWLCWFSRPVASMLTAYFCCRRSRCPCGQAREHRQGAHWSWGHGEDNELPSLWRHASYSGDPLGQWRGVCQGNQNPWKNDKKQ